jgi:CBS domain-containing protein
LDALEKSFAAANSEQRFLSHLARGALDFLPPLGFFNRLRSDNGKIDLKKGAPRADSRPSAPGRARRRFT